MSDAPPALEGVWQMIRAELAGERAPELVTSKTMLELAAGTYAVRYDGQVMDRGTYELGANAGNLTIILRGTNGTNAGRTIPCIFQLSGNRLRACYGLNGEMPTEFKTVLGHHCYLALYSRATSA